MNENINPHYQETIVHRKVLSHPIAGGDGTIFIASDSAKRTPHTDVSEVDEIQARKDGVNHVTTYRDILDRIEERAKAPEITRESVSQRIEDIKKHNAEIERAALERVRQELGRIIVGYDARLPKPAHEAPAIPQIISIEPLDMAAGGA